MKKIKRKSNNQKKEPWYAVTSKANMLRQIRGQGILSWLDTVKGKALIEACEEDILEFVNRECRAVRIKCKNG